MSLDYSALCLQFIYDILASEMTLEDGSVVSVIDKTAGIAVSDAIGIETLKPAVAVRKQSLIALDIDIEELLDMEVIVNGKTFTVISTKPSPGINGEDDGEVYLMLQEAD